jgi:dTDP-4-amino-4,6-dideoxygalactose transaminase
MDLPPPVTYDGLQAREQPATGFPRRQKRPTRRRLALVGGTTSFGDCLAVATFLLRPQRLVRGASIRRYELAFADYLGVRHGYSFSSGRVALFGILKALGIGEGDHVILQVPTHVVVANAVRYTGARPIFVDSSVSTCNVDLSALERGITGRTKAIVLQHTFGIPADLNAVLHIAHQRDISVIEDCVHALGARYRGARVGSLGRAAFFSTEETKTISTTMGGMAVTNDDALARRLQEFQQNCAFPSAWLTARYLAKLVFYHVLTEPHLHRYSRVLYEAFGSRNPLPGPTTGEEMLGGRPPGYERRLSNAQALVGLRQLQRIDENLAHRERVAAAFQSRLRTLGFEMPKPPPEATPAYVRVPVFVDDPHLAVQAAASDVVLGTWFTSVLEEATDPSVGGYLAGSCPSAEKLSQHLVNLPTHPRVSLDDVDPIVMTLSAVQSSRNHQSGASRGPASLIGPG